VNGALLYRSFTGAVPFRMEIGPFACYGDRVNVVAVRVSKIGFLPEMERLDLVGKARVSRDRGVSWQSLSVAAPYRAGAFPYEGYAHADCLQPWEHGYYEGSAVQLADGRIYVDREARRAAPQRDPGRVGA